ncbi:MAG: hypothetical protein ABIA04_00035 [Pseudomonadota bacterium]
MKRAIFIFLSLLLSSILFSCLESGSSDDSSGGTDVNNTGISEIAEIIQNVSDNMLPETLQYVEAAIPGVLKGFKNSGDSNPCAAFTGDDGLFACQPILLQLYLSMVSDFIDVPVSIISETEAEVDAATDGSTGEVSSVSLPYFEGTIETDIVFEKTDSENIVYNIYADNTYIAYLSVTNGDTFQFIHSSSFRDETIAFEADISYTDEDNFEISTVLSSPDCNDNDVAAPDTIQLINTITNGLSVGAAHLYSDLWLGDGGVENTCDTTPSDDTAASIVTRFVGNDTAAKGEPTIMLQTQTTLNEDDFSTYAMNNFATTFGMFDYPIDLTSYVNPFCIESSDIDTAIWDDNCEDYDTDVSGASFSSAGLIAPNTFKDYEVTSLPSAI